MGGFTGGAGDVSGGDAAAETGPQRGGDLALGGINIGTRGGIDTMQILVFAGIGLAAFLAFKLIK